MMLKPFAILIGTGVVCAQALLPMAQAHESQGLYIEGGYLFGKYEDPKVKFNPKAFRGVLGYHLSPLVSAELIGGIGRGRSTVVREDESGKAELSKLLGGFVKLNSTFSDDFSVFARMGVTHTGLRFTNANAAGTANTQGGQFAWGVGAALNLTRSTYVAADYMRYFNRDDAKINGFSLNYGMRF